MSGERYTEEFKIEAVKQVIDRGDKVGECPRSRKCQHEYGAFKQYVSVSTPSDRKKLLDAFLAGVVPM